MVEQGVRYLILLHFGNFVTVYFVDMMGTIVTVKNFDRTHDRQALAELPRVAKRILAYPREKKVPAKHEKLLEDINALQKQFHAQIRVAENISGLRLPSRNIPGIALTPQDQEGVIYIPAKIRSHPHLVRFFLMEAFRLFIPTTFKPHSELLTPFLVYIYTEDTTDRIELSQNFTAPIKTVLEQIRTESLTQQQIRPILSLLRWWARYEDRSLDIKTFQLFFTCAMTKLAQKPPDSQTEIVAALSMQLFQNQGDSRDLLRFVCTLILLDNPPQIQKYKVSEVFQSEDEIHQICLAMLTRRFRFLYQTPLALFQLNANPKLARLFHQAIDHLKAQILRIKRGISHLHLINQSDLELSNITLRTSSSDPSEMIEFIPYLKPGHNYELISSDDLESEQIIAEFTDNFHNSYSNLISVPINNDNSMGTS